jgi:hypothetical protein
MTLRELSTPLNQDIYSKKNVLNKNFYEFGIKTFDSLPINSLSSGFRSSHLDLAAAAALTNHQLSFKNVRRDYYKDAENSDDVESSKTAQESKIIVSSPPPSEIIRIDNTQRVMYKIDSPLTGVTTETIELQFKTTQADGVVFYITNNPIVSYFELVNGYPEAVIDGRHKNFNLRPKTPQLNDNRWHEVKLHRDGQHVSINIDSLYHDSTDLGHGYNQILTGGQVYLGIADPNNINLFHKKPFNGEMVRGKVTINNIQQRVEQQPYYWSQSASATSLLANQSSSMAHLNIDASQLKLAKDGKLNIVINVFGQPSFTVNTQQGGDLISDVNTHYIYLDRLPGKI